MVKASPEKKKEKTPMKGGLAKEMKKKKNKNNETAIVKQAPEDIVEFYGRNVTVAEKEKMDSIIQNIRRWSRKSDIKKFVEEFPAFITEGTLELSRSKVWKCVTCKKLGHPREICPKSWVDGKWIKLCYECGEPGAPHPACKEKLICYLCTAEGHIAKKCPDRKSKDANNKPAEEKENDDSQTLESPKKKLRSRGKKPLEEESQKSKSKKAKASK